MATILTPWSCALRAASSAASCAANGVLLREPLKPRVPELDQEITLPFSRITDVYVDQDMFDVFFGLYDVHISTPTQESGLFAHIDGVNKAGSQELRQMILDRINRSETAGAGVTS